MLGSAGALYLPFKNLPGPRLPAWPHATIPHLSCAPSMCASPQVHSQLATQPSQKDPPPHPGKYILVCFASSIPQTPPLPPHQTTHAPQKPHAHYKNQNNRVLCPRRHSRICLSAPLSLLSAFRVCVPFTCPTRTTRTRRSCCAVLRPPGPELFPPTPSRGPARPSGSPGGG